MLVPKTTVDENCNLVLFKHKIWLAGQSTIVKPVAKPLGKNKPSDKKLRLGVS